MSFIKRSDGTTVYAGGHATVRPSLADIRHGGASNQPETAQDKMWLKQIVAAMMPLGESAYFDSMYMNEEAGIISRLWGIYYGTCPAVQRNFNDEYFTPHDH
jgi:hypothetical protein